MLLVFQACECTEACQPDLSASALTRKSIGLTELYQISITLLIYKYMVPEIPKAFKLVSRQGCSTYCATLDVTA